MQTFFNFSFVLIAVIILMANLFMFFPDSYNSIYQHKKDSQYSKTAKRHRNSYSVPNEPIEYPKLSKGIYKFGKNVSKPLLKRGFSNLLKEYKQTIFGDNNEEILNEEVLDEEIVEPEVLRDEIVPFTAFSNEEFEDNEEDTNPFVAEVLKNIGKKNFISPVVKGKIEF